MTTVNVGKMRFEEARDFIKQKLLIPTKEWNNLIGPAHAKAFTVAGATKIELLKDLYTAVPSSIDNGTTITQFRKDFDSIVAKHGWSYKGKRGWRTSVIFRTNKRTAYMAGQWQQAWRLKEARPYLQYLTVGDERVRDSHAIHDKKVFRIDHPFWQTHYPPNGWLCRCTVRTLSDDDIEDQQLQVSDENAAQPIEWTDPKTGELTKGHKGIDIGWDYNVGQNWLAPDVILGQQIMSLPIELRSLANQTIKTTVYDLPFKALVDKVATNIAKKNTIKYNAAVTAGFMNNRTIDFLSTQGKVPIGTTYIVRDRDIYHWLREAKASQNKAIPFSLAASLPSILRQPDAILWDSNQQTLIIAKKLNDNQHAKWVIDLNYKSKITQSKMRFNEHLNVIKSAGIVLTTNLLEPKYKIVQGEIK